MPASGRRGLPAVGAYTENVSILYEGIMWRAPTEPTTAFVVSVHKHTLACVKHVSRHRDVNLPLFPYRCDIRFKTVFDIRFKIMCDSRFETVYESHFETVCDTHFETACDTRFEPYVILVLKPYVIPILNRM